MIKRMTQQESSGQDMSENNGHAADIQTISGLIKWLKIIAEDGDCNLDRDTIADTCREAAKLIDAALENVVQEYVRAENLQLFFDDVSEAIERAKST